MTAVLSLARHTFLDALRQRAYVVLGLFTVAMLATSRLVNPLALGEGRRVTIDLGLACMALFGFLLIALLSTRMVQKEIERKTILVLLAKPLRREEFILGKFFGLVAVTGVSLAAMLISLAGVLVLSGYAVDGSLIVAGYFAFLELFIVASLAMLLTVFTSPVLSTFFLVGLFVAGHLGSSLSDLASMLPSQLAGKLLAALFHVLPRLDLYSYTLEVIHGMPVSGGQLLWATLYALVYSVGALGLALLVFRYRELP